MSLPDRDHPIRDAAVWILGMLSWAAAMSLIGAAFFLIFAPWPPIIYVR